MTPRAALLRYTYAGHVAQAWPVVVVEDTPERVGVYVRAGTPLRWVDGDVDPGGFGTVARTWQDTNAVLLMERDRWSAIWPMWWAATGEFLCWYVNLQTPLVRSPLGWDTCDLELDVIVWGDGRCEWKDEEAFASKLERGIFTPEQGDAARREGERVIADVAAGRPPFSEPWPDWRPDPSWPIPSLPDDWDAHL